MKEDKSDKWIASSLKKHLEEGKLPYEVGAWEGFQKVRNARKRRNIYYWGGAVAASLLLLFGISQVLRMETSVPDDTLRNTEILSNQEKETMVETPNSDEENLVEPSESAIAIAPETSGDTEKTTPKTESKSSRTPKTDDSVKADKPLLAVAEEEVPKVKESESAIQKEELNAIAPPEEKKEIPLIAKKEEKAVAKAEETIPTKEESIPTKIENTTSTIATLDQKTEVKEEPKASITIVEPKNENKTIAMVEEKDFPEIPKDHTKVVLGMGVSPGFGAMQQNDVNTIASSIGVGMILDVDLPGKLTVGSGFGLNYMNQQNETQMPVTVAGYRTSQVEKQDIQQVQVEMPIYVKYPVTRNNSISIQAGFSNLYAINQNAEQLTTINEQVAVNGSLDAFSNSSSFAIQSNAVTQSRVLTNPDSKFYPFATVNLGVNIRFLETEKMNYMVMPFYNHQLRSISGFGNNFGMFGASLKLNFGGSDEK
ncbi:hypothetical protein FHS59_003222 [Algoriphagus iocasae]|uniref:Outer membrane protein beta-barrel domain-containing protein n=1 Tax=Algoriphagus iocasae TaxID=1836499 RepID=A0A841MPR2_9BACT|nr:hypothetical protein [Algoriphagus iocasae]MBB6327579.1 hypothetical protein [Algoriphagus iocasae]